MKNKLYLLLITVMACFALSACGDSDEGTKEMKTYEYDNSGGNAVCVTVKINPLLCRGRTDL